MGKNGGSSMHTYVFHNPNKREELAKAIIQACMEKNIESLLKTVESEMEKK